MTDAVDLFAGAGGWDLPARDLGLDVLGIELDGDACATREAAGLRTLQADVAALEPLEFGPVEGVIASAPCPSFSRAGKRLGLADFPLIEVAAARLAAGEDPRLTEWNDPRSGLTLEPLRWALALRPEWIAFEQVPDVLPLWRLFARHLEAAGYGCWTGSLYAEQYGVPQTRERAFLLARLDGVPSPPPASHQRYNYKRGRQDDLFGDLCPWVSMAEALGYGMTQRPSVTVTGGGSRQGGHSPLDGGSGARATLRREHEAGRWTWERPATTVVGSFSPDVIAAPGYRTKGDTSRQDAYGPIRVTETEAAVLQSFPVDHPWQGSRSSRFLQIGNAVPPLMARAVLKAVANLPIEVA